MPNKSYLKGVRFEREIVEELRKEGYQSNRIAGSHGFFDVFAVNNENMRLIQAKFDVNNGVIEKAKEELRKIAVPLCCKKEIWVKRSRQGWEIIEV